MKGPSIASKLPMEGKKLGTGEKTLGSVHQFSDYL
jgi:hypothetical protein